MANVSSKVIEVCVWKMFHNEARYLLLKRSERETLYPGIWQIVTGTVEGEEHAVRAALRELREETGLRPQHLWVVPHIGFSYSPISDTVILGPFFAAQVGDSDDPELSPEHQEYGWYEYERAKSMLVWPGQKKGLKIVHRYIVGGLETGKLTEVKNFSQFGRETS
ncbi:MAG: NUDIX hydrolase [Bacteroidota bacterium]